MPSDECYYRINGDLLRTDTVQDVVLNPHTARVQADEKRSEVNKGNTVTEDLGLSTGEIDIVFHLRGDPDSFGDELDFIVNHINSDVWTLKSSHQDEDKDALLWRNFDTLALSTNDIEQEPSKRYQHYTLRVRASLLGAWEADGGTFCLTRSGWFKQTNGSTFETEDGDSVSDFTITLPNQAPGYPKARRVSDGTLVEVSRQSKSDVQTRDGKDRREETYDLSGFLWPSDPSSTGDRGVWELHTCPSQSWLDQLLPPTVTMTATTSIDANLLLLETLDSSVTMSAATSLSGALTRSGDMDATLTDASVVSADLLLFAVAVATMSASTSMSAAATLEMVADSTITADTSISAVQTLIQSQGATMTSDSSISANIIVLTGFTASSTMTNDSSISAVQTLIQSQGATMTSDSSISANLIVVPLKVVSSTMTANTSMSGALNLVGAVTVDQFESGDLAQYAGDV